MTITVDLPPETEASLLAQANARGLTLDEFVKSIIANHAAVADALKPCDNLPHQSEALDKVIDEIFDTIEVPPGVGQGVMRREKYR